MNRLVLLFLLVTGGLTLLVTAMPWLVILGFIALILPGLILMAAPTLFLYGVAGAVPWLLLERFNRGLAGIAVIGGVAAAAIGIPLWLNRPLAKEEARLTAADHEPPHQLSIHGRVALDQDLRFGRNGKCDELCVALLQEPGVTAVEVGDSQFRRGSSRSPDAVQPSVGWSGAWDGWQPGEAQRIGEAARVRAALGDGLVQEARDGNEPDVTIDYERNTGSGPSIDYWQRLRLLSGGTETARSTVVRTAPLSVPMFVGMSGGLENVHFGLARRHKRYDESNLQTIALLRAWTGMALDAGPSNDLTQLRTAVRHALDDSGLGIGAPAFQIYGDYLDKLGGRGRSVAGPADISLLVRAVSDKRLSQQWRLADVIRQAGSAAAPLRAPIVARILALDFPTDSEAGRGLGQALGAFPAGSFNELTPAERRLLDDPDRRRWATGLIERQADRGADAISDLLAILDASWPPRANEDRTTNDCWGDDGEAVLRALSTMGPAARPALSHIDALITAGRIPTHLVEDRDFQVLRIRLGAPISSVSKPANMSGGEDRYRRTIVDLAGRKDWILHL